MPVTFPAKACFPAISTRPASVQVPRRPTCGFGGGQCAAGARPGQGNGRGLPATTGVAGRGRIRIAVEGAGRSVFPTDERGPSDATLSSATRMRLMRGIPAVRRGVTGRLHPGRCPICGPTIFDARGAWLRDDYLCRRCRSIPRQRALIFVLHQVVPNWPSRTILESSPSGTSVSADRAEVPCLHPFTFLQRRALRVVAGRRPQRRLTQTDPRRRLCRCCSHPGRL